jgi:hypothetical protein
MLLELFEYTISEYQGSQDLLASIKNVQSDKEKVIAGLIL